MRNTHAGYWMATWALLVLAIGCSDSGGALEYAAAPPADQGATLGAIPTDAAAASAPAATATVAETPTVEVAATLPAERTAPVATPTTTASATPSPPSETAQGPTAARAVESARASEATRRLEATRTQTPARSVEVAQENVGRSATLLAVATATTLNLLPDNCTLIAAIRPGEINTLAGQSFIPVSFQSDVKKFFADVPALLKGETTELTACVHLRPTPKEGTTEMIQILDFAYLSLTSATPFAPAAQSEMAAALTQYAGKSEKKESVVSGVSLTQYSDAEFDFVWIPMNTQRIVAVLARHDVAAALTNFAIASTKGLAANTEVMRRFSQLPDQTVRVLLNNATAGMLPKTDPTVEKILDALDMTSTSPISVGVAVNLNQTIGGGVQLWLDNGPLPDAQCSLAVATKWIAKHTEKLAALFKGETASTTTEPAPTFASDPAGH